MFEIRFTKWLRSLPNILQITSQLIGDHLPTCPTESRSSAELEQSMFTVNDNIPYIHTQHTPLFLLQYLIVTLSRFFCSSILILSRKLLNVLSLFYLTFCCPCMTIKYITVFLYHSPCITMRCLNRCLPNPSGLT